MIFWGCFELYYSFFSGTQGIAPDLWNYTMNSVESTETFLNHSTTSLSNFNAIPNTWLT